MNSLKIEPINLNFAISAVKKKPADSSSSNHSTSATTSRSSITNHKDYLLSKSFASTPQNVSISKSLNNLPSPLDVIKSEYKSSRVVEEPKEYITTVPRSEYLSGQLEILELKRKISTFEKEIRVRDEKFAAIMEENRILKEQNAALKAERDALRSSNATSNRQSTLPNSPLRNRLRRIRHVNSQHEETVEGSTSNFVNAGLANTSQGITQDELRSIITALQTAETAGNNTFRMTNSVNSSELFGGVRDSYNSQTERGSQSRQLNQTTSASLTSRINRLLSLYPDPNGLVSENASYEQLLHLQERIGQISRGLTRDQIKSIPKYEFQREIEDKLCTVCLCNFEDKEKMRKLKCNHEFHSKCIKTWLKEQRFCPICKTNAVSS